jgi:hypothetical protein
VAQASCLRAASLLHTTGWKPVPLFFRLAWLLSVARACLCSMGCGTAVLAKRRILS